MTFKISVEVVCDWCGARLVPCSVDKALWKTKLEAREMASYSYGWDRRRGGDMCSDCAIRRSRRAWRLKQ